MHTTTSRSTTRAAVSSPWSVMIQSTGVPLRTSRICSTNRNRAIFSSPLKIVRVFPGTPAITPMSRSATSSPAR